VQPGAAPRARAPEEPAQSLSRRELDWALSDFAALSRQIRIERVEDGGVRIAELERGSFLAKLGIKRGDVVLRVAGHPIDTVDQAAAAYAALADARDVVVELERRGKPLRLRYRLTR
jgi:S1-C subfamily serine protease